MNKAPQLYLCTYLRIDSIDHLIPNCRMKYMCWKYWYSPMLCAMSIAVVVDYDIYLKVEEGEIDKT